MSQILQTLNTDHVAVLNAEGKSSVVIVCEHASCFFPDTFDDLGLAGDALQSHAAWDPGAMAVAQFLSERLDATLVASGVSRLVYDCNRPTSAPDAMPEQSEAIRVPGNENLTPAQRAGRATHYYEPFRAHLAETIAAKLKPVVVTVHSFTPIYHGKKRAVEIGVLHDNDTRLADAMLKIADAHTSANVQRNAPYGPEDGVTHTLREHAIREGHLNVMLEIRNDLIKTAEQQYEMAKMIAGWIANAGVRAGATGVVQCQA